MPAVIENPILNSPFDAPSRHFRFDDEGITGDIVDKRRRSAYFVPIARPKKKGAQKTFDTEWTGDRVAENAQINRIRDRVDAWRQGGYVGVTAVTRGLLEHWASPSRERRLFFCQREAVETAIYLTEVATGSGKTVVMAMLIAWQALNKLDKRQDARFSDAFLIVTPGITIRDRLRVLLPSDPDNYYRALDVLPADLRERLGQARVVITNYHAFLLRERGDAAKLTKSILAGGARETSQDQASPFRETPDQMVRRVCRDLGNKKNIVVINDEAHHCYWGKANAGAEALSADERAEANEREKSARVWSSGLVAIQRKLGVRAVYDLSATPFFLSGSGYPEGTLFPWVVSDFSLIDAIEAGIVKIPRVPVADNSMIGEAPTYRELWPRIREDLPKKGRKTDAIGGAPRLPVELEGALLSLYGHYEKSFRAWEQAAQARSRGLTPPVFVVVCNNTNVSKLVFDWIAGWDTDARHEDGGPIVAAGKLALFSNEDHGRWRDRPNSILVDSTELESGEAMSAEFKAVAAAEIDEFKRECRVRFPGRNVDDLTDEDLLREVMNTVGKPGKLTVLPTRMNPDLAMGEELLKKTGAGNLFMVFGEPEVTIDRDIDGNIIVEINGLDVYDPTTGQIRSSSTDDIACWFVDTNYNGESFFVRHAYFTGADEPYEKLKRALRAEIDEGTWSTLYSTKSRPFAAPESGKIAVKVINHYGDEVLKVFQV